MKKIIPVAGMVLCEDTEDKPSGIVLAEEKDKQSQIGKVIDFFQSSGFKNKLDELANMDYHITLQDYHNMLLTKNLKKDDNIIYKKYSGSEVELEGKEYKLVAFQDIIGIIK